MTIWTTKPSPPARSAGWRAFVALPADSVVLNRLIRALQLREALAIYWWLRPLLDLDVITYLLQNIQLVEAVAIGSSDRVRAARAAAGRRAACRNRETYRDGSRDWPHLPRFPLSPVAPERH